MQVLARHPVVVKAGDQVELKGLGFKNTLVLALFDAGGVAVAQSLPVAVESATTARFTVPQAAKPGIYQLNASQDGQSQSLSLVFTADMLESAIFASDAQNICTGQKFYDLDGNVREGSKICEAKASSTSTSTNTDPSVTPRECSRDGDVGCLATNAYRAASTQDIDKKIIAGTTVAGVDGAVKLPTNCSQDGETGCLAVTNFPAVDKINKLTPGNIKSGVTIAEVTGAYPSTTHKLVGASDTSDLISLAATVSAGSYEWWDAAGTRYTGSITNAGTITPTPSDQIFNASVYSGFTVAGDADLIAGNIKSSINIFNVTGNLAGAPEACTSNAAVGCVTTASYKSADLTNLAVGNIKSGVSIAGVTGQYPSVDYALPSASTIADLDTATFNAKIKSSAEFEYWTSAGVRQTGSGDADIQDFNIKNGVSIFNTTGLYSGPPASPSGLTATVASGTQINLSWSNVGVSGYVLVAREGAAVSFVPVDGTTYTAGAQGSEQIVYVGSATSASHTGLTVGTTYHYALYSYDSIKNYAGPVRTSRAPSSINCSGLAGGTWVAVPGDSIYNTTEFCVQKYIPSGTNTSQAGVAPRVSLDQPTARSACTALGTGYHLITNPEWMTIAANIANTPSNWSNNVVGSGTMSRGHSDNNPGIACAADANDANAWVEGSCTGQTQGALAFNQRRTQNLSNGSVIWDFGGNVWQWVDLYNANGKPTPASNWVEYPNLVAGTNWPISAFVPRNDTQSWWNNSWNSAQSIGQIYTGGSDGSGGALLRGAPWGDDAIAGPFAASLSNVPSDTYTGIGFRCAWQP